METYFLQKKEKSSRRNHLEWLISEKKIRLQVIILFNWHPYPKPLQPLLRYSSLKKEIVLTDTVKQFLPRFPYYGIDIYCRVIDSNESVHTFVIDPIAFGLTKLKPLQITMY